jgi:hypothetical protein
MVSSNPSRETTSRAREQVRSELIGLCSLDFGRLSIATVTLLTSLHVANPWRPIPKFRPGTQCLLPAHRVISLRRGIWSLPGHSRHWSNPHQSSSIYEYTLLIRRNPLSKGQVPRAVCSLCDIVRINVRFTPSPDVARSVRSERCPRTDIGPKLKEAANWGGLTPNSVSSEPGAA